MPQVLSQALGKSQQHLLCIWGHSSLEQGYVSRVARLMSGKLRAQTSDWHQCSCSGSMRKCTQNKWPLGWGLKHCLASKWAKGAVVVVMDRVEGASVSGGQCREARPEEKQEGKGGVMRGRGVGCWGAICALDWGAKWGSGVRSWWLLSALWSLPGRLSAWPITGSDPRASGLCPNLTSAQKLPWPSYSRSIPWPTNPPPLLLPSLTYLNCGTIHLIQNLPFKRYK